MRGHEILLTLCLTSDLKTRYSIKKIDLYYSFPTFLNMCLVEDLEFESQFNILFIFSNIFVKQG